VDDIEKYNFDLNGYFVVKNMLSTKEAAGLLAAADRLETHVRNSVDKEPFFIGEFYLRYHHDREYGYNSYKSESGGLQLIVEDFFNAASEFDVLINHKKTLGYVSELAQGPCQLGSGELRYRYKGNITPTHMGGPIDSRNKYEFVGHPMLNPVTGSRAHRDFNLLTVRVIYALHDVPVENGPFSVVPGTHKANFFSPYEDDPTKEPGMVGIPMKAGDAIFFTENLRHGGLPNLLDTPRKTVHMMYSPVWVGSQSPAHWNKAPYITEETFARYDLDQRALFCQSTPGKLQLLRTVAKDPSGSSGAVLGPEPSKSLLVRGLKKLLG
jgi:hypothetical protein